jgi:hypothetical protein
VMSNVMKNNRIKIIKNYNTIDNFR